MKVLITGSNGFIGSAVTKALQEEGHTVTPYDRAQDNDVLDWGNLLNHMRGMDKVIHLAGVLGTDELFDTPHKAVDVNIHGTVNVLEACVEQHTGYIGITMPQVFPSIYTATKVCATRLASAYQQAHGLPVCHIQAFNAFGPDQAHGPGHPRKIIPAFSVEGWSNKPLIVWGDGNQAVDLIHSDELARLFVDALKLEDDQVIDGGSGQMWTVNEVAEFVIDYTQSTAGIDYRPMRRGEIPVPFLHANRITGNWHLLRRPPMLSIASLCRTIDAYRDHALVEFR